MPREGQSARERYDELVKEGHTRAEIQKLVGEKCNGTNGTTISSRKV
jgi:hypothetical protein